MTKNGRIISPYLVGLLFKLAGINHLLNSDFYANVMPPYIPAHLTMIYVSGFFQVLGGVGVFIPKLPRAAGWGLIALLIAVFPVHLHMVRYPSKYPLFPYWAIVTRIPLQFILIVWVEWSTRYHSTDPNPETQ